MKAVLITFDQAHYQRIIDELAKLNCRGFTSWEQVQGRGTTTGDPHYGSHAWPSMSAAIISVVEDHRLESVMKMLKTLDDERPKLGLRAFAWNIDSAI